MLYEILGFLMFLDWSIRAAVRAMPPPPPPPPISIVVGVEAP
jgi:hypothetical protein